jgi:hypothetical protein
MNFTFSNFFIGIIGFIIGIGVVSQAYNLNHHLYFLDFIEKKYGSGTGTTAYQMVGIILSLFSVMVMIGLVDFTGTTPGLNKNTTSNIQISNTVIIPSGGGSGTYISP